MFMTLSLVGKVYRCDIYIIFFSFFFSFYFSSLSFSSLCFSSFPSSLPFLPPFFHLCIVLFFSFLFLYFVNAMAGRWWVGTVIVYFVDYILFLLVVIIIIIIIIIGN